MGVSKIRGNPKWMVKIRENPIKMGVSKNRVFPKIGVSPNHPLKNRVFHYKPSILGYHYFWISTHICTESHEFDNLISLGLGPWKSNSPFCIGWFTDHHSFYSKALPSKRKHHVLNVGWISRD